MYGNSLPQSIRQQVIHCQQPVNKLRVDSFRSGIGFLRIYAQSLGLPVAIRQINSCKVRRKLPLFHTLMNMLVNWYAMCVCVGGWGGVISSLFRLKHMLALIQCFPNTMMIVKTDPYSVYKSIS